MKDVSQQFHNTLSLMVAFYSNVKLHRDQMHFLYARIRLYMDAQALQQFYPELHIRIDARDFMAKQSDGFNLIEYRLEEAELEAFEAWQQRDKITFHQALNYCAEKSIKVSFTFSEKDESWCVSFTGKADNRFNSGKTLTNWSDESMDAFFMGIYKITQIFQDGSWSTRKSSKRG